MIATGNGLAYSDKVRVWFRVLLFALLFSLAAGVGLFSVAPDGSYQIGPGTPSHDPSKYLWFFQENVLGWGNLIVEGVIFGSWWSLPIFIPLGFVVAAALSVLKPLAPFARRLITVRPVWFWLLTVLLGWLAGLGETIATGVFPGICC